MTFNQRLALLVGAAIAAAALIECAIRGWHALMARVDRNVERMVDDGLAALVTTDDDFAEYADEAIALTVPLYGAEAAGRIAAIIAHNEAARADWDEPSRWAR